MSLTTFRVKFFKIVPNILIILGLFFLILAYGPIIYDEVWYFWKSTKNQDISINNPNGVEDSPFARFLTTSPITIDPVNKDFSVVIEKIGVNAPVKADVSVVDEEAYFEALKEGVAHAVTSPYPSEDAGNVYLFAHSSINFWELGHYAKVFNLLRKLDLGDRVHVFYEGDDYIYEVVNKETLKGWNTYPLTRPVIEPTLTLQTCDPPGTTLNRLVVTATLLEVVEGKE
ncbi:MAG: sortase [Patescibacteria group bacterium]